MPARGRNLFWLLLALVGCTVTLRVLFLLWVRWRARGRRMPRALRSQRERGGPRIEGSDAENARTQHQPERPSEEKEAEITAGDWGPAASLVGGRSVSVSTSLWFEDGTVHDEAALHALLAFLAASCKDLYVISRCDSAEDEKEIQKKILVPAVVSAGLNPLKVLFCSTVEGRGHIARALEVECHLDQDVAVLQQLASFVPIRIRMTAKEGGTHLATYS